MTEQEPVDSKRQEILKLRESGLYLREIGQKFGISKQRVSDIIRGYRPRRKVELSSRIMLTTGEVSHILGIHGNTVRRWSDQGLLKSYKIGPRGDRRFRREDIDEFLSKNAPKNNDKSNKLEEIK